MPRLSALPGTVRLAAGCFAALVLGFVLLAQANLWYQVDGGRARIDGRGIESRSRNAPRRTDSPI